MQLLFWPIEIGYREAEGRLVVLLRGKTIDGKPVVVSDSTFRPYFYAELRAREDALKAQEVTDIEEVEKKLSDRPIRLLKIFTTLPRASKSVRQQLNCQCFEHDIRFTHRYCIDKGIVPLMLTSAKGEWIGEGNFEAEQVQPYSEESPRLKFLAIDIETYKPIFKPSKEENPIIIISLYSSSCQKILTWKRFQGLQEGIVEFLNSEADMLNRFEELLRELNPDIVVGYNSDGFDLPYLKARSEKYRLPLSNLIQISGKREKIGRLAGLCHIDLFKFIKSVISRSLDTEFYDLDSVAKELLGEGKEKIDLDAMPLAWDSGSEKLADYCTYCLQDSKLVYQLIEKLWPSILELVKIVNLPPFEATRSSFSKLVESYICRLAAASGQLIPPKPSHEEQSKRAAIKFKGAFVVQPRPGQYQDVAVLDFRSLYPSIIATHNISPGTLRCSCCMESSIAANGPVWFCKRQRGFISAAIEDLIARRARIKDLLKSKPKDALLLARSEALKILANAMYGYLGFAAARWYSLDCAQAATAYGRAYISKLIKAASEHGFDVIYGDTDSVFLTFQGKSKADVEKFVANINKSLPGLLELEIENFYKKGIFVFAKAAERGAKKKYALLDENGNLKIKGFESVRRNTAPIAREVQEKVIEIILKEGNLEKAKKYVNSILQKLKSNAIPIEKVTIVTTLRKEIQSYAVAAPHIAAALRAEKLLKTRPGMGALVPYVVIKGIGKISERVRLPNEISQEQYDGDYYIKNQVLPSVEKIFEVAGIALNKEIGQRRFGDFVLENF